MLCCMQGMVKKLTETEATLSTGEVMPYGLAVRSTDVQLQDIAPD